MAMTRGHRHSFHVLLGAAALWAHGAIAAADQELSRPAVVVATPVISPATGTYFPNPLRGLTVGISDATAGATIYYTTNDDTPTTSSTKYIGAIDVEHTETIKAIAVKSGDTSSAVASATYTLKLRTPQFTPAGGTYTTNVKVTIEDGPGVTIYYTINGDTPTTASKKYTAAIEVEHTGKIKAIAARTGYTSSAVASATYTLEAATPVFSPKAGTYTTDESVTITDATAGATIYYTRDGATPTTSSTKYTAAIKVTDNTTIKAIAVAAGHTESALASAAYIIAPLAATPVISPAGGVYDASRSVTITDATAGATIYYTTNGATPTTSSAKYTTAIAVSATETIKAIAVASGHTQSDVATAVYTINSPTAKTLLFTDNTGLWSLNETTNQVAQVAAITGDVNGVAYQAGSLATAGGKAYFAGGDADNPLGLYVSDGTSAGTKLLKTFPAGTGNPPATIADFTALSNGSALFVYYAGDGTQTLWTTNGSSVAEVTVAGTSANYVNSSGIFPSINLGPGQSGEIGGALLFTDNSGLWSLDESTSQVTKLAAITGDVNGVEFQAGSLAVAGGDAFFTGGDANNPVGFYVSDGTAAGTALNMAFAAGTQPPATIAQITAVPASGAVLFVYYGESGDQTLWISDNTGRTDEVVLAGTNTAYVNKSGTFPSINLGPGQSGQASGAFVFTDNGGVWSLANNTNGVTQLAAVTGDVNGVAYQAGSLAIAGGKAYFAGGDANNPLDLYVSDGTTAGTKLLKAFPAGTGAQPPAAIADFTALSNGSALFVYYAGDGTQTLWTTNGSSVAEVTVAGTSASYVNSSGVFPSINLGPGQSGEL